MTTEGIIQQVCKKYISNDALSYEAKNTAYQIEQDIIREIKMVIRPVCSCGCEEPGYIKKQLIGEK